MNMHDYYLETLLNEEEPPFIKNFRESTEQIPMQHFFGRKADLPVNLNLPNQDFYRNNENWQKMAVTPFSYKATEDGKRQYGLIYVPKDQAAKFVSMYDEDDEPIEDPDNIDIYGARLFDGPGSIDQSLTGQGFINLYNNVKDKDFRIDEKLRQAARHDYENIGLGGTPVMAGINWFKPRKSEVFQNLVDLIKEVMGSQK